MAKRKEIRQRGKIRFSRAFQDFKSGDVVSVDIEKSKPLKIPKRIQGRCGVVEGKRGKCFIVNINDLEKQKKFIIEPLHLKRINNNK